jgi:hypothetical protein
MGLNNKKMGGLDVSRDVVVIGELYAVDGSIVASIAPGRKAFTETCIFQLPAECQGLNGTPMEQDLRFDQKDR